MKLLLTGATGFLGRNILPHLGNYEIVCLCKPGSGDSLLSFPNVTVLHTDDWQLDKKLVESGVEMVVNIAGAYDKQIFSDVINSNLVFPLNIMSILASADLTKWININTSLERTFSSYSLSKHQLADWGKFFSSTCEFSFINVQLEQFYGAFDGRIISYVVGHLLKNEPLELTECLQRRDLIHVNDVCAAILYLIKAEFSEKYLDVPLGCGIAPQLKDVIEYCRAITGSTSDVKYGAVPIRPGEPMLSVADISILSKLGFTPTTNWKDGIKKVVEEMRV